MREALPGYNFCQQILSQVVEMPSNTLPVTVRVFSLSDVAELKGWIWIQY